MSDTNEPYEPYEPNVPIENSDSEDNQPAITGFSAMSDHESDSDDEELIPSTSRGYDSISLNTIYDNSMSDYSPPYLTEYDRHWPTNVVQTCDN